MNKRERLEAVLRGQGPDRAPVSFWHHFAPHETFGQAAVDAHLRHLEAYDLDFLKVMNDQRYPADFIIEGVHDLARVRELSGEEEPFARQLGLLQALRSAVGADIYMVSTVFNPWTVLRKMMAPESPIHRPPDLAVGRDPRDLKLNELLEQDRKGVHEALLTIARSLANFAVRCVASGADGVFLSVRDDWVDTGDNRAGTYDELVRPADLLIAESVAAAPFNMLHVCGRPLNFERFANYPFQVLNWADRYAGPSIAAVRDWVKPAICAGVDNLNTLARGTPAECELEVEDALRQAGTRPIIISAGCTYDPDSVKPENLRAVCRAARASRL